MKKGDFIKWTSSEDNKKFSHYGQLIWHKDGMIKMDDTYGGMMTFPDTDGTVKVVKKLPSGLSVEKSEGQYIPPPITKKRKVRTTGGPTKKQKSLELYKANIELSRKEMIELFCDELEMTPAGATTYVYNCKKELENS